jgi:hypothetical protein
MRVMGEARRNRLSAEAASAANAKRLAGQREELIARLREFRKSLRPAREYADEMLADGWEWVY